MAVKWTQRGINGIAGDEIDLGLFEHRAKLALGGEQTRPPAQSDDIDHIRQAVCGCHSRLRHSSPSPFIAGFLPHTRFPCLIRCHSQSGGTLLRPAGQLPSKLPDRPHGTLTRGSHVPLEPLASCSFLTARHMGSACQFIYYNTKTT